MFLKESSLGSGYCPLLWRLTWKEAPWLSIPPMGYKGQVHLKVPFSKEYRVWPVPALGDGTGAPSPLWLAGWTTSSQQKRTGNTAPTPVSHLRAEPIPQGSRMGMSCKHQRPAHECGQASLVCASAAACKPFLTEGHCCSSWKKDDSPFLIPPKLIRHTARIWMGRTKDCVCNWQVALWIRLLHTHEKPASVKQIWSTK